MNGSSYSSRTAQNGFSRHPGRGNAVEKPHNGKQTLGRLIRYFNAEKKYVILLIIFVVIGTAASVIFPGFQSTAIDRIVAGSYAELPPVLAAMAVACLIGGLCTLAQGWAGAVLSQRIVRHIRSDLFNSIVNLPLSYIDSHSHGDIMSRMTNDADNISNTISTSLSSFFSGILMLIGTAGMMIWYSAPLALLSLSVIILAVVLTMILTRYIRIWYARRQSLLGNLNGTVEEMVTGYRTVTAYNQQEKVIEDFNQTSDRLTKAGIIAEIIGGSMGPVHNMFNNISFVIVAVAGAWFALQGRISIGVISAFIVYSRQFSRPVNELAQLYGQLETAIAGAERIFELMDIPSEDKSGNRLEEEPQGIIEFRHVHFSYVPGKEVIHDFSLRIKAGKKIALVGATGSGKTTIINLLMRFYDTDSGEILLDGMNIRDIAAGDLRGAIGIVLQDTVLFSDTVRNNLTYADPSVSDAEVKEAAVLSHCDRIIRHLPSGYNTVLDSEGSSLSQGERQLIAIGRAFLSKPRILILDEATSSVDTRTEKDIQNAMIQLMKGRTSLIIAHRLSTIRDADEIIVMDHGRIVERGNHEELLERKGRYYDLYMTQFAGFTT